MHSALLLAIPQSCNESRAARTPAVAGRHCAARVKTEVDFTQQTAAEILANLVGAVSGRTSGRGAAG